MNLFCFSLEGSTDSLYEPTHGSSLIRDLIPTRVRSPSLQRNKDKWRGSDPCLSSDQPQTHTANAKKKKRRSTNKVPETSPIHLPSHIPTSSLDNETIDNTDRDPLEWQISRFKPNSVFNQNNHNKEIGRDFCQNAVLSVEERLEQLNLEKREKDPLTQGVNFEAWNPNYEPSDNQQQDLTGEAEEELKGTLKRIQRLVTVKKGSQSAAEEGKSSSDSSGHLADNIFKEGSPVITCIGLRKKTEKKLVKAASSPQQQQAKESNGRSGEGQWSSGALDHPWSPAEVPPPWDPSFHTCHRPQVEHRVLGFDFSLPRATDWDRFESLVQELDSKQSEFTTPRVIRSITDLDISESTHSPSFERFDGLRQHSSLLKPEEYGGTLSAGGEQLETNQASPGSLGRKIKSISHTMCKRMGKKHVKALSGDTIEETERSGEVGSGQSYAKGRRRSSISLESLYSRNSEQSSSSGVTSGSDNFSNRNSLRLDEDLPYTGQFCGRARVHTDFVPSPYDTESLKLTVGDVIDIISKPPMGIWTGMLNDKVGNFKFIYVDVLVDKEPELPQKMRSHRRNRRPQPKTLQELLDRLNLEEYASLLLLNGYKTVGDLRKLREKNLMELNVTDPEHRHRLLAAFECLKEPKRECHTEGKANQEIKSPSESITADLNDCPRDSGCYIPSDCCDTDAPLPSVHPSLAVS